MASRGSTRQSMAGPSLFQGLKYFIASSVPLDHQPGMRVNLGGNGAIEVDSIHKAQYVFTDSDDFEGVKEVQPGTAVVLPLWIERSLTNKVLQDPKHFSASPSDIFSTLVIATDHLPPGDVETVIAGTRARGGMYRDGLTRDVTHLLVLSPTGDKYRTARRHAGQTGIKIVLVHWFDDCFKVEHRLPEGPYEEPLLQAEQEIRQLENGEQLLKSDTPVKRGIIRIPERAKLFYDALKRAGTPPLNESPSKSTSSIRPQTDVWDGRRLLLSRSLMLSHDRRSTVIREIERCGGIVVSADFGGIRARKGDVDNQDAGMEEENEPDSDAEMEEDLQFELEFADGARTRDDLKLSERYRVSDKNEALLVIEGQVDVLVTKYRSGLAYLAALHRAGTQKEVAIATLPWVFYVQYSRAITSPKSQLLHFPVRRGAVQEIRGKTFTVSNYQGPARDYLKKLINIMAGPRGANVPETFTATLAKTTNLVIASRLEGKKVESAQNWNIPIVNHLWLEDTFKAWQGANLAEPRYTHWRSKITYGDLLPGCPVVESSNDAELRQDAKEVMEEMIAIGYKRKAINAVLASNIIGLQTADAPSQQLITASQEPTASYAEVEKTLRVQEGHMEVDADADIIPETSSPRRVAVISSERPSSVLETRIRYKPTPGRKLVPVITRPRSDSAPGQREIAALTSVLNHKEKYQVLSQQNPSGSKHSTTNSNFPSLSQPAASSSKQPAVDVEDQSSQITNPGAGIPPGTLLRSPWDPLKTTSGVVTNDSPLEFRRATKKRHILPKQDIKRRPAKDPVEILEDEDSDDARRGPEKKSSKRHARDHIRSEESLSEDEPTVSHRDNKAKREDAKPQSAGRGKKRNIQTQESDEEFRVETQDDLISRRRKVVGAAEKLRPLGIDISPDTLAKDGHIYPHRSMKKEIPEEPDDSEDDYKRDGNGKKAASSKAGKAIKRLRDSISGKEGAASTKKGGSKSTARKAIPTPDSDDSESEDAPKAERKPPAKKAAANKRKGKSKAPETPDLTPAPSENDEPAAPSTPSLSKPVSSELSSEEDKTQIPRARRGAATRATQLLHESIMPDANRFAQQMKAGDVRNDWEETKKRPRASIEEDTDTTDKRKRKKTGGKVTVKKERGTAIPNTGIRMLTSKVIIKDGNLRKLHDLGVQQVHDPLSCTHLVANAILRTEKFLCAISVSPIMVTEEWVLECLRTGNIVDTAPYLLQDELGEQKFKMSLESSLDHAKVTGKTLMKGHTFYLLFGAEENKVLINTLNAAAKSAGGAVSFKVPSLRQMENHEEDRHIVSDLKEESRWMSLAQKGIPIYNQEIIVSSILRQQLPSWDDRHMLLR